MISTVILTKNEEKNIVDCIESVSFSNEIIIIDDNSTDRTVEIAEAMKVKVFKRELGMDFSAQRNFGLSKANNEWILFIDADERVSNSLRLEIDAVINKDNYSGFLIKRDDYIWGKKLKHGETSNIWLLRLAKKNSGKWVGRVHEVWKVNGNIGRLKYPLSHFPHPEIGEFLSEINFYTTLRAKELYFQKKTVNPTNIIFFPIGKFIVNYFLRLGFLDGIRGLMVAIVMSFHSFLVRAKLWRLYQV